MRGPWGHTATCSSGPGPPWGDRSATTPRLQVVFERGAPASLELLAVDCPARGPNAHRLPEGRGGLVRREALEVHAVDVRRLRLHQETGRERAPHALPPQRGVHEEVVHDEDPPELRGRRVTGEGHPDDRPLLPGDEEDAGEPVLQDLLDGPRDRLDLRAASLRGDVRRDEALQRLSVPPCLPVGGGHYGKGGG